MRVEYSSPVRLQLQQKSLCTPRSLFSLFFSSLVLSSSSNGFGFNRFFREANGKVDELLKDDRPCNFLMDYNDAILTAPEIIQKYDYPVERHWVTTEDGYILEMHRIPKGLDKNRKPAPAVFLMHGVFSSSRDYVINCDRRALAFMLWDNGFDVWLGNMRGSTYSRNHTWLRANDPKFWDFSVDEMGYYDAPAMIDHIIRRTRISKVSCIGLSMGNGIGLTMLASRPEYNNKIHIWFAMAAAVTLSDTRSPVVKLAAPFSRLFEKVVGKFSHGELWTPPMLYFLNKYLPRVCRREGEVRNYHGICASFLFLNDGYDPGQISAEVYSVIAGGIPTSTSMKFVAQWLQWIISGSVSYYDEGPFKNLQTYGTLKPKRYPVEKIVVPFILYWAENDWITTSNDVSKSIQLLIPATNGTKSVGKREYIQVALPSWNHLDFAYGKDADIYVYNLIIKKLNTLYAENALY